MQSKPESAKSSTRTDRVYADSECAAKLVKDSLQQLQSGKVTFVVQDGVIVHVERLEKRRVV